MTPEDIAYLEFIHLPTYRRSAEALLDDEGQREIEAALCADPSLGAVIAGTGGVRKLRVALPGTGKSGGARLIYFYRQSRGRIYLILLYPKSRKDSLTKGERNEMRKLTAILEGEE
jgi:hypothetical protein